MTEKERLFFLLAGERIDRPPFIIPGGMMVMVVAEAMSKLNCFWPEAHTNPEKMAILVKGVHNLAGIENVGVPFCMTIEAEAMGAKVSLGTKETEPKVKEYAIDSVDEVQRLKPIIGMNNSRVDVVVKAIEILAKEFKDVPIIANVVGPISLATSLIDPLIFLRGVRKRKDDVHCLLKFITENLIFYAGTLVGAGADAVVIGDPTATGEILGPDVFKEFGLPYLNQITEELETRYKTKSIVHICGDIKSIVKEMNSLHAVGLSVDAVTNIRRLREEVKGKILMGNVSTYLLANGSPDRVTQAGINCLRNGADILSPACGISPKTPLENIKALARVVREYNGFKRGG